MEYIVKSVARISRLNGGSITTRDADYFNVNDTNGKRGREREDW